MTRGRAFEELRPLLFAIAYRILGSVAEAEDAVQETWLRYESSPARPTSAKAFLSAVVTRVSIDVLRSARVRRESYVGQWLPEPLLTDPYADPARSAELADSVSMAALVLLDVLGGRIQMIRSVVNPDKLRHVGPVADAANQWVADQQARGRTKAQIVEELKTFDQWDRYDSDADGSLLEVRPVG